MLLEIACISQVIVLPDIDIINRLTSYSKVSLKSLSKEPDIIINGFLPSSSSDCQTEGIVVILIVTLPSQPGPILELS